MDHVIDDSEMYYVHLRDEPVPPRREGKFVVLLKGGDRFLVFAPSACATYHADIVERFLKRRNVGGIRDPWKNRFLPASPDWRVDGGGIWRLDQRRLELLGHSTAYGGVDLDDVAAVVRRSEAFGAADVVIGE